jgi:hypothetical protein
MDQTDAGCLGPDNAERQWGRFLPHHELTPKLLPRPQAPWDELVWFAGTYSGYLVCPNTRLLEALTDRSLAAFRNDVSLPDGMTMLRAALHGEQRRDYWTGWGGGPPRERMELIHAMVERIRALVQRGMHRNPDPTTVGGIQDKVMNAYERLLSAYAEWGGHRFHGWTDYPDARNFHGPVIWSERDCGLRLAMELENEWPLGVHMEFAIGKATRDDYVPADERRQRVDVAVSDLSGFHEDETTAARYRTWRHEAFFEVKWLLKGWRGERFERDARRRVTEIAADRSKLARHLELGRCAVAAMFVVDDEGYFEEHADLDEWPTGVWRLVLSPHELAHRGLLQHGEENGHGSGSPDQDNAAAPQ